MAADHGARSHADVLDLVARWLLACSAVAGQRPSHQVPTAAPSDKPTDSFPGY